MEPCCAINHTLVNPAGECIKSHGPQGSLKPEAAVAVLLAFSLSLVGIVTVKIMLKLFIKHMSLACLRVKESSSFVLRVVSRSPLQRDTSQDVQRYLRALTQQTLATHARCVGSVGFPSQLKLHN